MKAFITNWIMRLGQSARIAIQIGRLKKFLNEFGMFIHDIREHVSSAGKVHPDCGDSLHQQAEQPCKAANSDASQNSSNEDDDFKLFEIHRIKNRLDPELIRTPGGYRDVAFKLKIGFVRY
jgi:hypothetical protein